MNEKFIAAVKSLVSDLVAARNSTSKGASDWEVNAKVSFEI